MSDLRKFIDTVSEAGAMPIGFERGPNKSFQASVLPELSCVRAVKEIRDSGQVVSEGSVGAIVDVSKTNGWYTIEFTSPKHAIVTAKRDEISPL